MRGEIYRLFRGQLFLHGYIVDLPDPSKESNDPSSVGLQCLHKPESECLISSTRTDTSSTTVSP